MSLNADNAGKNEWLASKVRNFKPGDGQAVAGVLRAAFPDKIRAIFGSHVEQGIRYLAYEFNIRQEHAPVFLTEIDGDVVGAIEMKLGREKKSRTIRLLRALLRDVGWRGAIRAAFGFAICTMEMPGTFGGGSAYIEVLGVKPEHQGRGIGHSLLGRAAMESRLAGKRSLMLDVAAGNEKAKQLYYGMGFRKVRTYNSLLTRWMFGIGEWELLELMLDGSGITE